MTKCNHCGKEWISKVIQGPKKYCSDDCRKQARKILSKSYSRWHEEICGRCGKSFHTQNKSKYCSLKCASEVKSEIAIKNRPVYYCRKCGKGFYRAKRPTDSIVYCSRKCAGNSEIGKARHPRDLRAGNNYKRAKIYGAAYESVNINKVFERDGWRCQICGKRTPKDNRGTTRHNAPELDHRVPISRGGGHLYSNVQCVCRRCNGIKSNKNEAGQLPLFAIEATTYRGGIESLENPRF